jgi:hypothetical protein
MRHRVLQGEFGGIAVFQSLAYRLLMLVVSKFVFAEFKLTTLKNPLSGKERRGGHLAR